MSEYTPITTDMRLLLGCFTKLTDFERDKFTQLCDAIDSIHAELERENEGIERENEELHRQVSRAAQLLVDAEKDRDDNYANWQDCKQKVLQHNITLSELDAEIERLRRELDERPIAVGPDALETMARLEHSVELPKDADGEYICADDDVEWMNGAKHGRVTGIGVGERDGWVWVLMEGKSVSIALKASDLHHCHSDTWESIIHDAMQAGRTDVTVDVTPLIKRCKALCERTMTATDAVMAKGGDAE